MLILYKPCQNVEEKTHSNSSCEANITLRLKPDIVSKENTHTHKPLQDQRPKESWHLIYQPLQTKDSFRHFKRIRCLL